MDNIKKRRSIRQYKDREVEQEKIEMLLRAGMQAPSAGNQQPWEFIVVQNRDRLKALSGLSPYASMVADAPVALILLASRERMTFRENGLQDMAACTQNILLEAVSQGLGAVWLGVAPLDERENYIRELFDLDETLIPFCVIPIGYPEEGKGNRFIDRFDAERIHFEEY